MKFIRFRILTHAIWILPPILLREGKSSDDTLGGFTPRKSFSFTASRHYQLPDHKHGLPGECNTFISVSYDQDIIYVGPRNNITDGNPLSKRKLHGLWYFIETNLNLHVGNNCTKKKVCVLIAHAGGSNFCVSLKLFKTWIYPCFIALVMFVPYTQHNLPLLNHWWKSKQNLAQPYHL